MIILGIIGFGILIGAAAQFILGRSAKGVDWGMALAAGLIGSFVGGLLISLLAGDGLAFKPSGVIGSIAGALIVTGSHGGVSEQRVPLVLNRPIAGLDPQRRWRNFDALDLALNWAQ
jgi:uncharacterized membrane protein YeaQ/YmgE (transglycosylase-associated protein family)